MRNCPKRQHKPPVAWEEGTAGSEDIGRDNGFSVHVDQPRPSTFQ